jgi:CBS domain-containing protein
MDIGEAITTDYLEFDPSTRVSKLMGAFKEHGSKALLIGSGEDVAGVVTRKQLVSSHHNPSEKAKNLMRDDIPQIDVRDDIREVSRLVVESDLNLLPVYDGDAFEGIATAGSIVRAVQPNLDALDVSDVYTRDLVAVDPETTLGTVINRLRTHGISRVPVIENTGGSGRTETTERTSGDTEIEEPTERDAVGMASYYDIIDFIVRENQRMEGGNTGGFDGHQGSGSRGNYRTHTGYGDRAGDDARLLDLPVGNVMNSPVKVTGPTTPLGDAAGEMLDNDYTSLVVELPEEGPDGILTLTDVLRSLTWTPDEETRLQVFGMNLLTDLTREDVASMIEEVDSKYEEMDVIEAYVVLQNHRERQRGMPLIRATIRLFTNKGRFAGTGEEYGAAPAIRAARDRLERTVLDDKGHALEERNSPGTREEAEHLVGWWLES